MLGRAGLSGWSKNILQQASKQFLIFAAGQLLDVVWIARFSACFCFVGVCLRMRAREIIAVRTVVLLIYVLFMPMLLVIWMLNLLIL